MTAYPSTNPLIDRSVLACLLACLLAHPHEIERARPVTSHCLYLAKLLLLLVAHDLLLRHHRPPSSDSCCCPVITEPYRYRLEVEDLT